jgi:chaperone modulatory protein CbpM
MSTDMIMKKHQFLAHTDLKGEVLEVWLAEGWLLPDQQEGEPTFSDADLARARLIQDLRGDLGVNDEGIGVILNLLDQLHGLRGRLRLLLAGLEEQPPEVRTRLRDVLRARTQASDPDTL